MIPAQTNHRTRAAIREYRTRLANSPAERLTLLAAIRDALNERRAARALPYNHNHPKGCPDCRAIGAGPCIA